MPGDPADDIDDPTGGSKRAHREMADRVDHLTRSLAEILADAA